MYARDFKLPKLVAGKRDSGYPKLPVATGGKYSGSKNRHGCRLPPIVKPQLPQIEAKSITYRGKRIVIQLPSAIEPHIVARHVRQGKNSDSSSDSSSDWQHKMCSLSSDEYFSSFDVDDDNYPVPLLKLPAAIINFDFDATDGLGKFDYIAIS